MMKLAEEISLLSSQEIDKLNINLVRLTDRLGEFGKKIEKHTEILERHERVQVDSNLSVQSIEKSLQNGTERMQRIEDECSKKVEQSEFKPVKAIVYGAVKIILAAVLIATVALVVTQA